MKKFNRNLLPTPIDTLNRLGIKIVRSNSSGYLILRCPVHKEGNEKRPSLNLHQQSGHFRCHSCGIKGSDILAFYITVTGKTFKQSVTDLNAWEVKNG